MNLYIIQNLQKKLGIFIIIFFVVLSLCYIKDLLNFSITALQGVGIIIPPFIGGENTDNKWCQDLGLAVPNPPPTPLDFILKP